MVHLADRGSRDPVVRERVVQVLGAAGVSPHDVPAQVDAWFEFVRDGIYFLHDPDSTEWLQSPRYTLHAGSGDCDDRATLLAAGLKGFGVPARFKTTASDPRRPHVMTHVYVEALVPDWARRRQVWTVYDPTYPGNRMGDEPPFRSRVWRVPV